MKKLSKGTVAVLIVLIAVAIIVGAKSNLLNGSSEDINQARAKGNPDAPVKIIEYIDFQCPACARGSMILNQFFEKYPDQIYLDMKYYPLRMHAHAFVSAQYAECSARQGQFWPFHDEILRRQEEWRKLKDPLPIFEEIAKNLDLNMGKLKACTQRDEIKAIINSDKQSGKDRGLKSTPTYYINDKMIVGPKSLLAELMSLMPKENDN